MKMSYEVYRRLLNNSINIKANKYHNKKVIVNGIKFDSKKESKRYQQLKILEKANLISELELQKIFELQPKYTNANGEHIRAITYKADFYYYDNQKQKYIIEDTKGVKTEVYKIKKKLLEYKYKDLIINEI